MPLNELAAVEGFDEETAQELQSRAVEYIEARNKALDDKRRELGVEDAVAEVEGVTPPMLVALGEAGVKTLDDLAGCATDDLLGYYEVNKDKERVRIPGALEGFNLTPDDANAIIMKARVKIGWIEATPEARSRRRRGGRDRGRRRLNAADDVATTKTKRDGCASGAASSRAKSCPTKRASVSSWRPDGQIVPDIDGRAARPRHLGDGGAGGGRQGGRQEALLPRRQGRRAMPTLDLPDRVEKASGGADDGRSRAGAASGRAGAGLRQCRACACRSGRRRRF